MGWLSNWQYRKKITIQGQSGAGTDYQVLLKVGESSGASGYDFHVEGHSANFPSDKNQSGDLRFTKSDGTTLLKFWVEKVEGTSPNRVAYCWVKIEDNLDNNVDIYCYYGNSSTTNVSSGDDTFLLFDDFNGSNLDTNKWNELNSGPLSFSNSIMSIKSDTENTNHDIYSKDAFSYGHCLRGRVAIKQKTCFAFENSNHTEGVLEWYDASDNWNFGVRTGGSLNFDSLGSADIGAWHIDEIIYKSGEGKLRRDGVDKATKTSGVPTIALPVNSRSWSSTNEIQVDWIAVRKYISPEPSFSSASGEEKEVTETYAINVLLQNLENKNYNIDLLVKKILDKNYDISTLLQKIIYKNYNISSLLQELISKNYDINLLIQHLNISFDCLINALFQATKSYSYNLEISLFDTNYIFFDGMILQLIWNDEFNNSEIDAIKRLTLAQSYNIQEFNVCEKPITLEATENQGWLTRKQVEMLYQKASIPNKTYPLIYNGKHYLVRFRWEDPPVIDVTPILPRPNMADDDYYYGTIKLMQILR